MIIKKILTIWFGLLITGVCSTGAARAAAPVSVSLIHPLQMVSEVEDVTGIRVNCLYGVNDDVTGIDFGIFNRTIGVQKGLQLGIYNDTHDMRGLQFGFINRTDWLDGVQIGILNYYTKNAGEKKLFPFFNWAF